MPNSQSRNHEINKTIPKQENNSKAVPLIHSKLNLSLDMQLILEL